MPTANYFGTLADVGLELLTSNRPVVKVRPLEAAYVKSGQLVSSAPKAVTINDAGRFDLKLVPSGDLTGSVSGQIGIDYVISVGRFEDAADGQRFHGTDLYRFTAVAGGGNIAAMQGASLLAVWLGPPWPPLPSPAGLYIDKTPPNYWGVRS